jgi:hypothetical protein
MSKTGDFLSYWNEVAWWQVILVILMYLGVCVLGVVGGAGRGGGDPKALV